MDERQAKPDGNRRKTRGSLTMRGTKDDDQEEEGHHHFTDKSCHERKLARGMRAKSIRRETASQGITAIARCYHVKDPGAQKGADDLGNDIRHCVSGLEAPTGDQAQSHCWVEMSARHMANRISHGQHRKAKGKRNAKEANTNLRELSR